MRNFARLTSCHSQICAGHGSPGHICRAGASPAIYAMTIVQGKGRTLQHISCPAANEYARQLNKTRLVDSNHELTRINTNYCCSGGRVGCASSFILPLSTFSVRPVRQWTDSSRGELGLIPRTSNRPQGHSFSNLSPPSRGAEMKARALSRSETMKINTSAR